MHKLKRITGVSMKRTSRVLPSILGASWQWMLSVMQSPHFEQPLIYPAINRNIDRSLFQKMVVDSLSRVVNLLSYINETDPRYSRLCEVVGKGMGATDPKKAEKGTIRSLYGV